MPALDSLPAPPTLGNRWSQLPPSPSVQMELITKARQNLTILVNNSVKKSSSTPLPRVLPRTDYGNVGQLIGQEQLAGTSQMLCHYRNTSASAAVPDLATAPPPISLICQLGCCPHSPGGCCTLEDESGGGGGANPALASVSSTYHWAMALLCAFILCVFVSTLAMLALYWANRRQQRRREERRRRFLLAEKYSLGIGSSQPSSNYGAPSLASSSGSRQNSQPPFCGGAAFPGGGGQFRHFYSANTPPSLPSPDRRVMGPIMASQLHSPHLFRSYHQMHNNNNGNSPPASSSSAYHAPDEVFFRSSF